MIKFTIATCTFNAAAVLQRTLDSVSAQIHPAVEHLIIDGLSTDGTVEMARKYNTKVVSERDHGLYDAMNKALRLATGDYILFLNAGDTFPSSSTLADIAACVEQVASQTPAGHGKDGLPGVLYGDTDIVDGNGQFLRHRRLSSPKRLTWCSFKRGMLVCHQAFYSRTDIARETPYNLTYRYSADVDWCIRVMKECEKRGLKLLNTGMIVANFLDGGMTTQNHRASLKERFQVMTTHYGLIQTVLYHAYFILRSIFRR